MALRPQQASIAQQILKKTPRPRPSRDVEYIFVKPTRFGGTMNMPGDDAPEMRLATIRRLLRRNRIGPAPVNGKAHPWTKIMLDAFEAKEKRREANPIDGKPKGKSDPDAAVRAASGLSDEAFDALDEGTLDQLRRLHADAK